MTLTVEHTKAAFVEFDVSRNTRRAAWNTCSTDAEVKACIKADDDALHKLRLAYYKDTNDRNSLNNCMMADLDFMERMVKDFG